MNLQMQIDTGKLTKKLDTRAQDLSINWLFDHKKMFQLSWKDLLERFLFFVIGFGIVVGKKKQFKHVTFIWHFTDETMIPIDCEIDNELNF